MTYYYEIHEGSDEVGSQVIVAHETRFQPLDFLKLVKKARTKILDTFEEDTLTEAVAAELQRSHGFTFIADDRLTAAVNLSAKDEDTFLAATGDQHRSIYLSLDEQ